MRFRRSSLSNKLFLLQRILINRGSFLGTSSRVPSGSCIRLLTCSAMGLMNMHIPEQYGGLGLGSIEACIVGMDLARL